MAEEAFHRILLKLSGEALLGKEDYGIDPDIIHRLAVEINDVTKLGIQVAVVIGGGNIFRGAGLAESGIDRVTGDNMGMLATVVNSLALQDALESTSMSMPASCPPSRCMTCVRTTSAAAPPGTWKKAASSLCRRHRQPVFYHRHGRCPARHRDRCRHCI